MEADIKLCEDLLAMDNFNVKGETRERPDRETPGRRPTPPERGSSPERKIGPRAIHQTPLPSLTRASPPSPTHPGGAGKSSAEIAADAAAAASGRLTDERRGEIMNRLNKHKESTRLASGSGDSSMTAAERRERVQQLLMERQTRLSSEGTARKGG